MTLHPALEALQGVNVQRGVPLSQYTRFSIGGPADFFIESSEESVFLQALRNVRASGLPYLVLGGGTNLIVADEGYRGVILRYTGAELNGEGGVIHVAAGAVLQHLVDFSIAQALEGLHTMTGIPGWVGAAIYGNAGAYGHSISEFVDTVRFFDGERIRCANRTECEFGYRESIFKRHKDWIVLSAVLRLPAGDAVLLRHEASRILSTRNAKYPPTMKCAGSIFKNLLVRQLTADVQSQVPAAVVREGKVPSAWFLEQVGAKGMRRGGIVVADYHANLIYNEGGGTSTELRAVIRELKARVKEHFGLEIEEEVQFVG
ncbi:MAG: UDP-N-acetylmuramate dehydrogenase [Bryobacterales bacterium]|nr:UDP-N-acetylmuramate dehydrogenase [Bryobacterales bacterium]